MKETRMNINNHDVVISYNDRDDVYELWIEETLCITANKIQMQQFIHFINTSIDFISKIEHITNEEANSIKDL